MTRTQRNKNKGLIYHYLEGLPETFDILLSLKILDRCKSLESFINEYEKAVLEEGYKPYLNNKPVDSVMKSMVKDIELLSSLFTAYDNFLNDNFLDDNYLDESQSLNSYPTNFHKHTQPSFQPSSNKPSFTSQTQTSQPGPCFKQFMSKNCTDPNCKFSHRPEDLRKLSREIFNNWNTPNLALMDKSSQIFSPNFSEESPEIDPEIIDKLSSIHTLLDPENRPASIVLGFIKVDNIEIRLENVLLDTGALHRSYISPKIFNLHLDGKQTLSRKLTLVFYWETIKQLRK